MTLITPAFKLTLLLSLGLHLAAFVQYGDHTQGFHQDNVNSRLNVTLSPSSRTDSMSDNDQPSESADKPPKKKLREEKSLNQSSEQKIRKVADVSRPTRFDQPAGELRQMAGDMQAGMLQDENYQSRLLRHLEQYKRYPFMARRRQLEGRASMRIAIAADGELRDIECLTGNDLFCDAAIRAARDAQPFPPPPTSLSDKAFDYAMEYKLR